MSRPPSTPKGTKRGPSSMRNGQFVRADKFCKKCSAVKPVSDFVVKTYRKQSGDRGVNLSSQCRDCIRKNKRQYYEDNREMFLEKTKRWEALYPDRTRRNARYTALRKVLRKFGLTVDDYERMLIEQDGKCAICKQMPPVHHCSKYEDAFNRLSVDHCHKTGRVRGLLCRRCNLALGNLFESEPAALGLVEYIRTKCK